MISHQSIVNRSSVSFCCKRLPIVLTGYMCITMSILLIIFRKLQGVTFRWACGWKTNCAPREASWYFLPLDSNSNNQKGIFVIFHNF